MRTIVNQGLGFPKRRPGLRNVKIHGAAETEQANSTPCGTCNHSTLKPKPTQPSRPSFGKQSVSGVPGLEAAKICKLSVVSNHLTGNQIRSMHISVYISHVFSIWLHLRFRSVVAAACCGESDK